MLNRGRLRGPLLGWETLLLCVFAIIIVGVVLVLVVALGFCQSVVLVWIVRVKVSGATFLHFAVSTFQRVRTSTLRVGQPNGIQFNFNFGLGHFLANATTDNALPIGER